MSSESDAYAEYEELVKVYGADWYDDNWYDADWYDIMTRQWDQDDYDRVLDTLSKKTRIYQERRPRFVDWLKFRI